MRDPSKKSVQPLSVLVVDDNLLIRSMIESSLKSARNEGGNIINGVQFSS